MSRKQEDNSLDSESESILMEAKMTLANTAIYRHDTTKALKLYSQVQTPQAAWNQSQVYMLVNSNMSTCIHIVSSDIFADG